MQWLCMLTAAKLIPAGIKYGMVSVNVLQESKAIDVGFENINCRGRAGK